MKKASYRIIERGLCTVTIFVEGCQEARQHTFTGWGIDDAIRNANKRLNLFGWEIEKQEVTS